MIKHLDIENLHCIYASAGGNKKIAYILYPMDILTDWIQTAVEKYNVTIVVITGMDWQDVMSPWKAKGVPDGTPDFKGVAPQFLTLLQTIVLPQIEAELNVTGKPERTLVGVSMSGLFALWQWMLCDTFLNIASLSGSFWYENFIEWFKTINLPVKKGKAYFLLGNQESKSRIKAFNSVERNTLEIIDILDKHGIKTEYDSVPGNHYSYPIQRLEKAFSAIF